jgi:hypothetical protein
MPAVAKDTEAFPGFTLKALLASLITQGNSLAAIQKVAKMNFPRKNAEAIERLTYRLLKRINRKGVKVQILTDKVFEKAEKPIVVKGLDLTKFAKTPKAKAPKKASVADKVIARATHVKAKGKKAPVVDDDSDVQDG